ncbi:MAG: RNA pseudouridine synthase [Bacteroidetes bacterium]|nr:RNA pseudouridine synthase [Bacteroidota bacterium]
MTLEILLETDDLVVVAKPSGMLTLPDRFDAALASVRGQLQQLYGEVFTVHRIDKDTSGLLIFARHLQAQRFLTQQFEERLVQKTYLGLVIGRVAADQASFQEPLEEHPTQKGKMRVSRHGKPALTHSTTLERWGRFSWLSIDIETGRTHQIRVHLSHAGHPIVCDPLYGTGEPVLLSSIKKHYKPSGTEPAERPILDRLGLHAWRLRVSDLSGQPLQIEAPLPRDLDACLRQLRKWQRL